MANLTASENSEHAIDREQLAQAFATFNDISTQLSETYSALQNQVTQLNAELAIANGALAEQYAEKEAMLVEMARNERLTSMGQMAASLAHQLRTPLATAMLYVANLQEPHLTEELRNRFATKALGRLQDLEKMVQDMLQFVRGEHSVSSIEESFSINALLEAVRQIITPQLLASGITLAVESLTEDAHIQGDMQEVQGALLNLLDNAHQASPRNASIYLKASKTSEKISVVVEDEGAGIAPEIREKLFDPFFTTRPDGTGLGLAIVRQVIDRFHGEIIVESQYNAAKTGTTFTVTFPLASSL